MTAQHQSDTLLHRLNTLPPKRYGAFLLNDDYTTMEFVVEIPTEIFMLGQEQAVAVMLLVHHEVKACAALTRAILPKPNSNKSCSGQKPAASAAMYCRGDLICLHPNWNRFPAALPRGAQGSL